MPDFVANFTLEPQPTIGADFNINVTNTEHNLLINRDLPDQHPISAITGLQDALNTIPADYVSDAELEAALLEKQDVIRDLSEIRQGATLGATAVQPSDLESYATTDYVDDGLSEKQDVLTAGANIQIVGNTISATDTTYTAGTGISIVGNVISNTQTSAEWGNITGTLSAQTDLQNALNLKANTADIPTATSDLTNDSGFITSVALTPYATQNYVNTALSNKQDTLTQTQLDAVNSGANSTNIGQIATNTSDIADINALIPNQASSSNQLADKDFVNSSIATNTATFRGTFNSVTELNAYSGEKDNNDYAFVTGEDSLGNTYYDNYIYNGTAWVYRYRLNNSSFTAAQWASINSGATSENIAKISTNETTINNHIANKNNPHEVTKAQIGLGNVDNTSDLNKPISTATQTALDNKQDTLTQTQLNAVNSGANTTNISQITTNTSNIADIQAVIPTSAAINNKLTDKTYVDTELADKANNTNIVNGAPLSNTSSYFYGISNSAATDVEKIVSIPSITTLNAGQIIVVQPTTTSTVADSTLKLNNFSAYPMRYNGSAISTSTDAQVWNSNRPSAFVFDGSYWVFLCKGYDTDTTYTINYSYDAGKYTAGIGTYAISSYCLCLQKPDGTWEKPTNTSKKHTTATTKTVNTNGFILNQLRYYSGTSTYANGAKISSNVFYQKAASMNTAYSFNCGTAPGWTAGDYIYLVGTMGVDGLFYLDTTTWWSNVLPSTNDGKLYIRLGLALTSTDATMSFFSDRPIFYHNGTKICEYKVADNKQDTLISGTNIKTINNESLLGNGNINIQSGGSYTAGNGIDITNNEISIDNTVALKSEIPTNNNQLTNGAGYITGITSSDVTTALGYTPYNSTNPNGYITSSALSPYVLSTDLATVATSGSYNDLSNKPTIPTVNNATLTITQDGVSKGTFTANASSDVTIALDNGGSLPSQTGQSGKFLTTDGTDPSWATIYAMVITDYTA